MRVFIWFHGIYHPMIRKWMKGDLIFATPSPTHTLRLCYIDSIELRHWGKSQERRLFPMTGDPPSVASRDDQMSLLLKWPWHAMAMVNPISLTLPSQ
jgi:hypothetical protein